MGMMDLAKDIDNAKEPMVVEADQEYKLRIVSCRVGENKNGDPYLLPRFEITSEPYAKEFTKYLAVPHSGMTEKQRNGTAYALQTFFRAFEFDHSRPFDPEEDLIGLEGWALLGVEESEEYGESNFVKKFLVRE